MAIRVTGRSPHKRRLSEVSEEVARIEGDCPDAERATVECRPLNYGQHNAVTVLFPQFERRYRSLEDWSVQLSGDWGDAWRELVYHSLAKASNILGDYDKEVFRWGEGGLCGSKEGFIEAMNSLPVAVAHAICRVAWEANPDLEMQGLMMNDPLTYLAAYHPEIRDEYYKWVEEETDALKNE